MKKIKRGTTKTLGAVHTHTCILTQGGLASSKKLGFIVVQKMYIKYRNFKVGLCSKIVCPFCVQKAMMNSE